VRPLLRELIVEIVRIGMLLNDSEQHRCLSVVLTNQLARAPTAPVSLPMPADRRARRVADTVLAALDQDLPVSSFARGAGASARTIERLFTRETGLSFGRWRQQARIQHAVRRLAEGAPVTTVSLECGYSSTSAFVSMFKKALGTTPGKYLAGQDS